MCFPSPQVKKPDVKPLPAPEETAKNLEVDQSPQNRTADANRRGRASLRIDLTRPNPGTRPGLQIPQ